MCVCAWVCMMCTIWNRDWGTWSHLELSFGLSWAIFGFKSETSKIVTILAPELCFRVWRGQRGSKQCTFLPRTILLELPIQKTNPKIRFFSRKNSFFDNLWFHLNRTIILGGQGARISGGQILTFGASSVFCLYKLI